jgi:hypothetical protein
MDAKRTALIEFLNHERLATVAVGDDESKQLLITQGVAEEQITILESADKLH